MTSAITRAPGGAAHAHGFAKSLKGDAPAEGFEALFAAVAAAQPAPVTPPVGDAVGKRADHGKAGEGDAQDDERASSQALLIAASMTLVAPDVKVIDPRNVPVAANSHAVAMGPAPAAPRVPAFENTTADSTPPQAAPAPASQRIVPNAAFAISEPVAHELIAHKVRVAESPVVPAADPPRVPRAPIVSEAAASPATHAPDPPGVSVPSHIETRTLSPAPPSSPPQAPVERTRSALSPRALVQAAMVEVVRSPGRGRTPPPEAANADTQDAAEPQTQPPAPSAPAAATIPAAASDAISDATPAPVASNPIPLPPIVEQAVIADTTQPFVAPSQAPKPSPTSRAAADIARQRQYVLASSESPSPAAGDSSEIAAPTFQTLIALRKADGTREDRVPATPSNAWLANVPASTTQAPSSMTAAAMPRTFDQAAWGAALAQQVTAAAVAATRETTVRIKPDGLGPIEVRVRIESQHVDVRFAIEHPVTVNMVREALPDLQRMLAQSGLSLGDAQVAQQNAGSRGQASNDASASQAGEDETAAPVRSAVETRPRARVGLLDDFV